MFNSLSDVLYVLVVAAVLFSLVFLRVQKHAVLLISDFTLCKVCVCVFVCVWVYISCWLGF